MGEQARRRLPTRQRRHRHPRPRVHRAARQVELPGAQRGLAELRALADALAATPEDTPMWTFDGGGTVAVFLACDALRTASASLSRPISPANASALSDTSTSHCCCWGSC